MLHGSSQPEESTSDTETGTRETTDGSSAVHIATTEEIASAQALADEGEAVTITLLQARLKITGYQHAKRIFDAWTAGKERMRAGHGADDPSCPAVEGGAASTTIAVAAEGPTAPPLPQPAVQAGNIATATSSSAVNEGDAAPERTVSVEIGSGTLIRTEASHPHPAEDLAEFMDGLVATRRLRPHEENTKIYGVKDSVDDLVKSIRAFGILDPLIITRDGKVISGHRRLRAAEELGILEVPVRVFESEDETDILNALLCANRQRVKTKSQVAAEARLELEIEKKFAARRKAVATKTVEVETLPPTRGKKSRDAVGQKLNLSGKTVEKAAKASEAILILRADGRLEEADKVERALNKGYDTGLKAAEQTGVVPTSNPKRKPTTKKKGKQTRSKTSELNSAAPDDSTDAGGIAPDPNAALDNDGALALARRVVAFLAGQVADDLTDGMKGDWKVLFDDLGDCLADLGM